MADPMTGYNGYHVDALPIEQLFEMLPSLKNGIEIAFTDQGLDGL